MTYFNCLSDIACLYFKQLLTYFNSINKSCVDLCSGLHICGTLLWCMDQQSGADLWWLPHAVWLLGFGPGVVCCAHEQMESNKDIFLWVR